MTLAELLDHLAKNQLDDRSELLNGAPDSLWDNAVLVRYLNEAQRQFCRKAWPIVDDETEACCRITILENEPRYELHRSVINVLSVTPSDTDIPMSPLNFPTIAPVPYYGTPYYYQVPPQPAIEEGGRPVWYSLDEATKVLRIRPKPSATAVTDIVTLKLRVARLPVIELTEDDLEAEPEIPYEYHLNLCDFAAGSALQQANVDSETKDEGAKFVAKFYQSLRAAKNDRLNAQRQAGRYLFGGWARTTVY